MKTIPAIPTRLLTSTESARTFHNVSCLREGMKPLSEIVRPILKTMIVNAALHGAITRERAERLIRERNLGSA